MDAPALAPRTMNLASLIDRIRRDHVQLQQERQAVHELNQNVQQETEAVSRLVWLAKHERYVRNAPAEQPVQLAERINRARDRLDWQPGHQWLGPNHERCVGDLLRELRAQPRSLAYMLFFAETKRPEAVELLCKVLVSSLYQHRGSWPDRGALIETMEELMDINVNFEEDAERLRRHLHGKYSAFGLLYRDFCDELPELRTFYRVALRRPVMAVLAEDTLFLDIEPERAVLRFQPQERQKHFGQSDTAEYRAKLARYQRWAVHRLQHFVEQMVRSLRENVSALPQSLLWLAARIYGRLLDRFECSAVNAILVDLIFFFLVCPGIQNPDLFGITDLHVNPIAGYNLMQCAQIIQMLALSQWEPQAQAGPYRVVCELFEPNSLGFVLERILAVAQSARPPAPVAVSLRSPHFFISDQELRFLLQYCHQYVAANGQHDAGDPVAGALRRLASSVAMAPDPDPASCYTPEKVLMIRDVECPQITIGTKSEQQLLAVIDQSLDDRHLALEQLAQQLDQVIDLETDQPSTAAELAPTASERRITLDHLIDRPEPAQHHTSLLPDDVSPGEEWAEMSMQSLGTLTLNLADLPEEPLPGSPPESGKSNVGHKVLTGIKSIKNRVKSISLKEPAAGRPSGPETSESGDLEAAAARKAETDEIFGKYRRSGESSQQGGCTDRSPTPLRPETPPPAAAAVTDELDPVLELKAKLRKLICSTDLIEVHRAGYRYLELGQKTELSMLLKILMSQSGDEIGTTVLVMDVLRQLETVGQEQLAEAFGQLEADWRASAPLTTIYLIRARHHLLGQLQQLRLTRSGLEIERRCTDFVLMSVMARRLLEQHEPAIRRLIGKLAAGTAAPDEKASLVKQLLAEVLHQGCCRPLTEQQRELLGQILERHLMSRIYLYAFYPNGDIDQMRDQVLREQIGQLAGTLSHHSKLLNIAPRHYRSSPWTSAQAELGLMAACKTPRDKVQCVVRSCCHIMALLNQDGGAPSAADDLLPVLIYVLIKANPASILSTIQYVNTFYLSDMPGEQAYYWTQFCSAVQFIKTILNQQSAI